MVRKLTPGPVPVPGPKRICLAELPARSKGLTSRNSYYFIREQNKLVNAYS